MALSTNRASSSSVPRAIQWKYDVFLSFRGETRLRFTAFLDQKLKALGIKTFLDDADLEKGKLISSELSSAIEQSRLAIIVISPNYASSTWCLNELVKVLECMEARDAILPIFYDLEPSDVRKQKESFEKAFRDHEKRFDTNKLKEWKAALTKVANLKGWTSKNRYEPQLIEEIVQNVQTKVPPVFFESKKLVGIEPRLERLYNLLDVESDDVRFIGICGMDGIGKTTTAKIARKTLRNKFDESRFFSVREVSEQHGPVNVQRRFCESLTKRTSEYWDETDEESTMINFLVQKKVFLILDDVDDISQLENLCGKKNWFGPGSRIIITTADEQLLVKHGVDIFKLPKLDDREAIQLFSWKAFERDDPDKDFTAISLSFAGYADGIPLALEALGSYLHKRGLQEWNSAWLKLKDGHSLDNDISRKIMKVLKISYDGLDKEQKNIFLDIACFFVGKCKDQVFEILYSCGFHLDIGINVLVEKSMIIISDNMVLMHNLFQAMAQGIVVQESQHPGERSRLWLSKDIYPVLRNSTGTKSVEGIVQPFPESKDTKCDPQAFSQMPNLRLLKIHNVRLPRGLTCLSNSLRFLKWRGYPEKSLPSDFEPNGLVKLSMCHSSIEQLWDEEETFEKLKVIKLSHSLHLTRTPNCYGVLNLERLDLEGCESLVVIHPSIGVLKKLTFLNLKDCKRLESLPDKIAMESLESFVLSGCSSVEKIPEFVRPMEHLTKISLDGTAIKSIPPSIGYLTSLSSLDSRDCIHLSCLPSTIGNLKSLKSLYVSGCINLAELPESFGELESLEEIVTSGTSIKKWPSSSVPENLKSMTSHGGPSEQTCVMPMKSHDPCSSFLPPLSRVPALVQLDISGRNLSEGEFPIDIGCLSFLVSLNLSGNNFLSLPKEISQLNTLENLNLSGCKKLQHVPVLSSDKNLEVIADGCTALKMLQCPSNLDRLKWSCFNFINCIGLVDHEIPLTMLKRYLKGAHCPGDRYEIVIPGSKIPSWFCRQRVGSSVSLPLNLHKQKWMGYALCALFQVLKSGWQLACVLKVNGKQEYPVPLFAANVTPLSNHLWFFYVSRDLSFGTNSQTSYNQLTFSFESSTRSLVKRCGVRLVYEEDLQDFSKIVAQSSVSISPEEEAVDDLHRDGTSRSVQSGTIKWSYKDNDGEGPAASGSFDEEPDLKRSKNR
ncbi:hypothetical protein L3X38_041901 [Prunus dulcis]|uniref:ADP-ribosyl cyclase/cyclic ADP-ribose hydrolase n=1 Tax=Prunus dulcis TaxID=3755 RepID=A0AAD4YJS6_PRUDU|nr:hypothetical protein L3X38_041901 [Prunus dulcis]